MKGHYEGIDKKTMHAMKARKLASDVSLIFHQLNIVQTYSYITTTSICILMSHMTIL